MKDPIQSQVEAEMKFQKDAELKKAEGAVAKELGWEKGARNSLGYCWECDFEAGAHHHICAFGAAVNRQLLLQTTVKDQADDDTEIRKLAAPFPPFISIPASLIYSPPHMNPSPLTHAKGKGETE